MYNKRLGVRHLNPVRVLLVDKLMSSLTMALGLAEGFRPHKIATAPETRGVAIEVPE